MVSSSPTTETILPMEEGTTVPLEIEGENAGPGLNRRAYSRLISRMQKAKKREKLQELADERSQKKKEKRNKRNRIAKKSRKQNRKK